MVGHSSFPATAELLLLAIGSCIAAGTAVQPVGKGLAFSSVFAPGMVLQRGERTKIWGSGAVPKSTVHVTVDRVTCVSVSTSTGDWICTLP
eukprot:COSAG02_NODE_35078_length_474_cov_0.752000_1_plen_90_part_01